MRAKSETRLIVNPQAHEANNVAESVKITATPTIMASRLPSANNTRITTESVAKNNF